MSGSGATAALSMGPSAGYMSILKLVKFNLFFTIISMMFINIFAANLSSSKITHVHIFAITIFLLFFWINFNMKLPKFLTIQKPDIRQFFISGFAAALKPNDFDETNYKIWRAKMVLWLTAMNCYHITHGKPEQFTPMEEQKFLATDNLFRGAVISALHSKYENKYIMEQLFDYKMVDNRSVVEQAHKIQALAKELE
jgi:hypothetical protein